MFATVCPFVVLCGSTAKAIQGVECVRVAVGSECMEHVLHLLWRSLRVAAARTLRRTRVLSSCCCVLSCLLGVSVYTEIVVWIRQTARLNCEGRRWREGVASVPVGTRAQMGSLGKFKGASIDICAWCVHV